MIKKTLIPSDPRVFKNILLRTRVAKRTIKYIDGTERVEVWNADNFKPTSNLMNNITSQLWHRNDKAYIAEAIYEIVGYEELRDFQDFDTDVDTSIPFCITYSRGWSSFRPVGEHVAGYVINNGWIGSAYNNGFSAGKSERRKISPVDLRELCLILDRAYHTGAFAKSDTNINTVHGPLHTYEYEYRGLVGKNCGSLFTDDYLNARFNDLIDKILK